MRIGRFQISLRSTFQRLQGWAFWRRPKAANEIVAAADRDLVFSLSPSRVPTLKQLRLLSKVLQPKDRSLIRLWSGLAVAAVITLITQVLVANLHFQPASGGTLTEGMVGTPQYINPVLARASTIDDVLTHLTFRGLMTIDADGQIVPDLASTLTSSNEGKTYTAKLRPNLRWSDGEELTSHDVVFTFETIIDTSYKSPLAPAWRGVTLTATDDQTVVFTLPAAANSFPSLLTTGLLPAHAWLDTSPQTFALAELNTKPTISNGPFQFQSLTKDRNGTIRSYTFARNKLYHHSAPYLDKLIVKFYPDQPQALEALGDRSIDTLGNITLADVDDVTKQERITAWPIAQLTAIFFNQGKNPALKTKEVRQALASAVDREPIITDVLHGYATPIIGPILPGALAYNESLKRFDYNPVAAEKILEDAGWKRNEQGIRQKGSQQLTFTFSFVDEPTSKATAERIVAGWRAIGAQVEGKMISPGDIQRDVIRPRNYEALLFGQRYEADADPYLFWHSSQQRDPGFNLSVFFNKKIDQDLEDGRVTTSIDQRRTDYLDFQNILADEVPAIFLYQSQYLYAHPKSLRGIEAKRLVAGADRFLDVDNWYVKRRLSWK